MSEKILRVQQHYQTKNSRGFMHPLSKISEEFVDFAKSNSPVIDMGCAYGNVAIAALNAGAQHVIACDMEMEHLKILEQNAGSGNADRLQLKQGIFPDEFDFAENSIAAIYASHILPFLNGAEVEQGLKKFYRWLKPRGRLFILCYTIFIKELNNQVFIKEYTRRKQNKIAWPGYLENYNDYIVMGDNEEQSENEPFPSSFHIFEREILVNELEKIGFQIEFADYLDGKKHGAVKETLLDGRELLEIIVVK